MRACVENELAAWIGTDGPLSPTLRQCRKDARLSRDLFQQ